MAVAQLRGFFDDSGDDTDPRHNAFCVAGYVGDAEAWQKFEVQWAEALRRHEVPYSHMKDFAHFVPPFDKWKGPAKIEERKTFIRDLAAVIKGCGLKGFGTLIRLKELERFNTDHATNIDPIACALYGNLLELHIAYETAAFIEVIVDHFDRAHKKIEIATKYAETDGYYENAGQKIWMKPLSKELTFKDVPAMQAADFAAYELKKFNEDNNDWYANIAPNINKRYWYLSLFEFQRQRDGHLRTPHGNRRGSLDALSAAAKIEGAVWDYRTFETAHKFRKAGSWTSTNG